jgi:carboxymethylenebutenolidase
MTQMRTEVIQTADGERFDGHVTAPESRHGPAILLLQEIFGVNDFLKGKAADLAGLGYVVLCPDVFWRVERNVDLAHDEPSMASAFGYMEQFMAVDPGVTASDLLSALSTLRSLPETTGRAGVMGYCLGGRLAYEVAVAGDPDTCVSYYGSGIADRLDDAAKITCPILFHFGGNDPYIPMDQIERIREAFKGRPDVVVHVQEAAGHAFENSLAPQFSRPEAAARSWPLTVDFLSTTLNRP